MLKNKIQPKKPLQKRRAKKSDDRKQPVNIFKLVKDVPKEIRTLSIFPSHSLNLKYAEALLKFCEEKLPEKIEGLNFNRGDSVGNLIYELTEIIVAAQFTICYDEYFAERPMVDFQYTSIKYAWHWYIMQAKHLSMIKSRELKIAFCHVMEKFGNQVNEVSFINKDHSTFQNSIDIIDGDYFESSFYCGEFDTEFKTFEEFQQHILEPYQDCKAEYESLVHLSIDDFHNYKPKNKPESALKNLLEQGLKLDYSIIHRFPDSEETHTHDGELVSYTDSFMLVYDWQEMVEENMMVFYNSNANENGVTYPVNYFRWKGGKIENGPSKEEEKQLQDLCNFLSNLSDFFD